MRELPVHLRMHGLLINLCGSPGRRRPAIWRDPSAGRQTGGMAARQLERVVGGLRDGSDTAGRLRKRRRRSYNQNDRDNCTFHFDPRQLGNDPSDWEVEKRKTAGTPFRSGQYLRAVAVSMDQRTTDSRGRRTEASAEVAALSPFQQTPDPLALLATVDLVRRARALDGSACRIGWRITLPFPREQLLLQHECLAIVVLQ